MTYSLEGEKIFRPIDHNSGLSQPPIFILGITPRSGTNFLYDLLVLHPHCQASLAGEDFFLAYSELLLKYVNSISKKWKLHWKIKRYTDQPERLVIQCLGEGLISFLSLRVGPDAIPESEMILGQSPPKRQVTKTPNVKNLSSFFTLFPRAYLLILIRDGR